MSPLDIIVRCAVPLAGVLAFLPARSRQREQTAFEELAALLEEGARASGGR